MQTPSRRSRIRRVRVLARSAVLVTAASVAFTAGCSSGSSGGAAPAADPAFGGLHRAMCQAAAAAEAGDEARAESTFDDAHTGLHDLAAAASARDRQAAGRLLEAKQRVEAGGDAGTRRALVVAVAAALEAAGQPAPTPCP